MWGYTQILRYLFTDIDKILYKIHNGPKVLLLLDYDGTLTPIVKKPELAQLSGANRRLLQNLGKKLILGIISGRSLKDIKHLVKVPGIIYAGNHGLEIEFPGKVYSHTKNKSFGVGVYVIPGVSGFSKLLDKLASILYQRLVHIPGVIVEHKGLTLSLHYRSVNRLRHAEVRRLFNNVVNPFIKTDKVEITTGKKVFEIRPPIEWDKGRVVVKIMRRVKGGVLPIYIGDDVTDEDAFKAIRNNGITIYVGRPRESYAQYFVWNVEEVIRFLRKIYNLRHSD